MASAADQSVPRWRGFHHIAIATSQLDATVRFYREVLGMHVGEIFPATEQRGRHVFVRPGQTDAWGLHFWEHPAAPRRDPPDEWSAETLGVYSFTWGALNHVAFALPDENAARALCARLEAHGIRVTPPSSIGPMRNTLFFDNNGIMLEATWPLEHTADHNAVSIVSAWQQAANDRDAARLIELSDPQIELVGPRGAARGREQLRPWLERAGLQLTTLRTWSAGDAVVLEQHGVWRDVQTGASRGEAGVASVFRVGDARVTYFARYDTPAEALSAAGLDAADEIVGGKESANTRE